MVAATKNSKRKLFHKPIHHVGMGHFMSFLTTFCQISAALAAPKGFVISPFNEIFFIFGVGAIFLALSCKKW